MDKHLSRLSHSPRFARGTAFVVCLLLVLFQPAFGQTEISKNKEQFMSALASMPYTSTGSGPVLYVLEYSDCPDCRAFESDLRARPGTKVQIRRIFYAISEKTANETAYLAQTKDINDFYAFMDGTKAAPAFRNNKISTDAFNSVAGPLKNVIRPIMTLNGWPFKTPVHPHFLWESNGRAYMTGGYTKELLTEILSMVNSGAHVAQASAPPSRESAGIASGSSRNEIAPLADRLDIVGVKIGMPLAQAIQALNTHNPKFNIKTGEIQFANVSTPNAWFVVAEDQLSHEFVQLHLALPPQQSVVTEIVRYVALPKGKEPTITSVMESLQSKYGKDFVRINREPTLYVLRLDGQPVVQPSKQGGCYYDLSPISPERRFMRESDGPTEVPRDLRDASTRLASLCGVVVTASIKPVYGNEQLASTLRMRVSSEPFRVKSLQNTVEYLNGLDQARKNREAAERKGVEVKM
jgi:hypothetical protein